MVGFVVCYWSLEKRDKWGRLLMCLYRHGVMALMIVYEGLDLLITRDAC